MFVLQEDSTTERIIVLISSVAHCCCLLRHIFFVEKEKMKQLSTFPNREDFNFQREAYECRIPLPVETEIHTTWNALVAQTSPTVSSCNAIIPRCRGKGSPIFCVADFYCLVQHLST